MAFYISLLISDLKIQMMCYAFFCIILQDPTIATSHVVLDLVDVVGGPDTIDYSNVKPGKDEEEQQSNAR